MEYVIKMKMEAESVAPVEAMLRRWLNNMTAEELNLLRNTKIQHTAVEIDIEAEEDGT